MAALQCEICGGKLVGKPGGIFECDSCGMEYSTEWAKAKIQEIKGTVKVEGTVEVTGKVQVEGGSALFRSCEIRSLVDARGIGFVAAPAHSLSQSRGFVFQNCRLTRQPGVADGSIYLARPWRDYGMVTFENCSMDSHIAPAGYDKWNDTHRDETARFYENPAPEGRVGWLNR